MRIIAGCKRCSRLRKGTTPLHIPSEESPHRVFVQFVVSNRVEKIFFALLDETFLMCYTLM